MKDKIEQICRDFFDKLGVELEQMKAIEEKE
jgi:hypothetical protein